MSWKSSVLSLVLTVSAGLSVIACSQPAGPSPDQAGAGRNEGLSAPAPIVSETAQAKQASVAILNRGLTRGSLAGGESIEYRFDVPHGSVVRLAFTAGAPGCYRLSLLDQMQRSVTESSCLSDQQTLLYIDGRNGGTYTLKLNSIATSAYTVELAVEKQNDAGSGFDGGDSFANATPVTQRRSQGVVGGQDRFDFFKLEASASTVLEFWKGIDAKCCLRVVLLDAQERPVSQTAHLSVAARLTLDFKEAGLAAEAYFLRIEGDGDGGEYGFELR